jgi:glycerol dehydrogenase
VEANTLLSGVGFESGGLAAAHAMAAGLTVIPVLHRDFLHGELVAIGLVAHLILEEDPDEARRVARFLTEVGLPVCLKQFGLDRQKDAAALWNAMTMAMNEPFVHFEPVEVNPHELLSALTGADEMGAAILNEVGDAAFRRLHSR